MPSKSTPTLLSLEDLLPEALRENLKSLSPGISWALDSFAVSFGEEINNLDSAAREAFARLTLNYGENLHRFLEMAAEQVDPKEVDERNRKKTLLRHLDLFSQLNEFDLGQIASAFEPVVYQEGEMLAVEGEEGRAVFFVEKGRVGIIVEGNQVAIRGKGALFGETSCITGEPVNATLKAVAETLALRISRENFENLVLKLPEIVPKIARIGFSRLEEVTHRLSEVLSHMPDALLKIDSEGIITGDISSKCFQYLGKDDLTGIRFSDIFFKDHPPSRQLWERLFPELWKNPGRFHDPEFSIPRTSDFVLGNEDLRHYSVSLAPCFRRGKQEGFDVAISDLTEHKRIQEERERMERALQRQKKQFMLFRLREETYGVEIEKVQEIIEMPVVTRIPNAPPFLRGFFNLRGRIVPALDLAVLLRLPPTGEAQGENTIFIVEYPADGQLASLGLITDGVDEILEVYENDISKAPEVGVEAGGMDFMYGIATVGEAVHLLLNVKDLLTLDDRDAVTALASQAIEGGEET